MQHLALFYHKVIEERRLLWSGPYDEDKTQQVKTDLKELLGSREVHWSPKLKAWLLPEDCGYLARQVIGVRFGVAAICSACDHARPCAFWKATQERAAREGLGGVLSVLWRNETRDSAYLTERRNYQSLLREERELQRASNFVAPQTPATTTQQRPVPPDTPPQRDGVTSSGNMAPVTVNVNGPAATWLRRLRQDAEALGISLPPARQRAATEQPTNNVDMGEGPLTFERLQEALLGRRVVVGVDLAQEPTREIIRDGRPILIPKNAVKVYDRGADFFDCYVPVQTSRRSLFVEKARQMGGVYNAERKAWFFANEQEPEVRSLCIRIFRNYDPSRRFLVVLEGQSRVVLGHSQAKRILQVFDADQCPLRQGPIKQVEHLRQELAREEALEGLDCERWGSLPTEDRLWSDAFDLTAEEWKRYEQHRKYGCTYCRGGK